MKGGASSRTARAKARSDAPGAGPAPEVRVASGASGIPRAVSREGGAGDPGADGGASVTRGPAAGGRGGGSGDRARRLSVSSPSLLVRGAARRLPRPARRVLIAVRARWRTLAERMRARWHRSLQLRVVATTLVFSAAVVAVLGFILMQQITNVLIGNKEKLSATLFSDGLAVGQGQPGLNRAPSADADAAAAFMYPLDRGLQSRSGPGSTYYVVIMVAPSQAPVYIRGVFEGIDAASSIPSRLVAMVNEEQAKSPVSQPWGTPTTVVYSSGSASAPGFAIGAPLGSYYQMYYVFPLDQEQRTLQLVQRTLIGVGLGLIALLAAIASLVTRWVVLPVRNAAQAAERLSAGQLEERMQVRGTDDLAALATAFNEMAASLQEKLRELEELSKVQRQFVSDVSHELRTPLTTIRIAADVLFEARQQLRSSAARSAELLQSQLERFEALLSDLLEISRYDANAATLEAESVDVCDLVRRSADIAQQLAERRGARIEFRLPAEPCVAEVDRRRVERILRNLLVNAVEHGEGRDVVVTAAGDRDTVAVAVRDHGCGLGPGEELLVFDRFWRADPARARTTGGTGLGLSIALEDARLHGGWLQAWGEKRKGSVFRLTLPRVAGEELVGSPLPLGPDETEVLPGSGPMAAAGLGVPGTVLGGSPGDLSGTGLSGAPSGQHAEAEVGVSD